jgi:hypothetical protein
MMTMKKKKKPSMKTKKKPSMKTKKKPSMKTKKKPSMKTKKKKKSMMAAAASSSSSSSSSSTAVAAAAAGAQDRRILLCLNSLGKRCIPPQNNHYPMWGTKARECWWCRVNERERTRTRFGCSRCEITLCKACFLDMHAAAARLGHRVSNK